MPLVRLAALTLVSVSVAAWGAAAPAHAQESATIVSAVDGDTLDVLHQDGRREEVQLVGVDAPQREAPAECGGADATDFAARFAGQQVRLTTDGLQGTKDEAGRTLAYADTAAGDVGLELLKAGLATTYDPGGRSFDRAQPYIAAEREAIAAMRAIHAACESFHSPLIEEEAPPPRSETAENHVRRFYFRLNERRFPSAWAMLSKGLRARLGSYSGWRAGYGRTIGTRVNRVDVTLTSGRAIVRVAIRSRDRDACSGRIVAQFFRSRWVLSRSAGRWLSTGVTSRKVGGGRVRLSKSECRRPKPTRRPRPESGGGGGGSGSGAGCHPSYVPCVPNDRDYDCGELNGPFQVIGSDDYRLDADDDGVGCE